jgi:battenin
MPAPVNPLVFWVLGLLNNTSYAIMLASAKSISEGGTALVYIANIIPSVTIKISGPYWFDKVSYDTRITTAAILMASSFLTVGFFQGTSADYPLYFQLLGVSLISAQTGLGEASLLALAGASDASRHQPECLTYFAAGTGFAGFFGYFFVYSLHAIFGAMRATLLCGVCLAVMYFFVYWKFLWGRKKPKGQLVTIPLKGPVDHIELMDGYNPAVIPVPAARRSLEIEAFEDEYSVPTPLVVKIHDMNAYQRLRLTLSLWPYILPLFLVFGGEYSLRSGTWTAIGFPITDMQARNDFYFAANWAHKAGVFISRSSGSLFLAPMWFLWLMPALQFVNVGFFWIVASHHVFYNWWLLVSCFYTGLLGGTVYVHGYKRICKDLPKEHTEFALSTTSVGEVLGILSADICGLFVQSCLYAINGLSGAAVECPFIEHTY